MTACPDLIFFWKTLVLKHLHQLQIDFDLLNVLYSMFFCIFEVEISETILHKKLALKKQISSLEEWVINSIPKTMQHPACSNHTSTIVMSVGKTVWLFFMPGANRTSHRISFLSPNRGLSNPLGSIQLSKRVRGHSM